MIFAPKVVARIAAIIALALLLQLSFFSEITIFGTTPDIMPVLVVCLGLLGGSLAGAVIGFATGLAVDSVLIQTLGASSLALLLAGYLAGRFREQFDLTNSLMPFFLAGGLTLVAVTAFSLIQFMTGVEAPVSGLVIRDAIIKSLLNVFLAIPIWLGIRRALRPALVADPALRRAQRRPSRATRTIGA